MPWSPLGAGFLTDAMAENTRFDRADFRANVPRLAPEALKANLTLVDLVREWARCKSARPAQVALAWLLAKMPWTVVIPGATKLKRLDENLGALAVAFTFEDLREIDESASKIEVQGARYPEKLEHLTGALSACRSVRSQDYEQQYRRKSRRHHD